MSQPQKKSKEKSADSSSADPLAGLAELLRPMLDFHRPVEGAEEEDVRIFWDVRCVKGEAEALAHLTGSSTMSGLLSKKMLPEASTLIIREIDVKIAQPLASKFQAMTEDDSLDSLPALTYSERGALDGEEPDGAEMAQLMDKNADE